MTNYMRSITFYLLTALLLIGHNGAKAQLQDKDLLPLARTVVLSNGTFKLDSNVKINIEAPQEDKVKLENLLNECLNTGKKSKGKTLNLLVRENVDGIEAPEGYNIEIGKKKIINLALF